MALSLGVSENLTQMPTESMWPNNTYFYKEGILEYRELAEGGSGVKTLPEMQETWVLSRGGMICWGRVWQPTPVYLPRESHAQRRLAGCSP